MYNNNELNNNLVNSLVDELSKLNSYINLNSNMSELIKHSGIFLYGFNPGAKVDPDAYRRYVSFTNAISSVLDDFDIAKRNNGYAYIVDAVALIIDQSRLDIRLGDDVYPYIKTKYNLRNESIIEHNIRNAIKSSYKRCHEDNCKSRMQYYSKKPSNKEFILTVTNEVCNMMCQDLVNYMI